jgi:TRAP-type uncharacterized transport system fused permease subunit
MDILTAIIYIVLALLSIWIAQTKVRHEFLRYVVNGIALIFLFLATMNLYPGFLSKGGDELTMVDFGVMVVIIVVWVVIRRSFNKPDPLAK